MDSLAKKIKLEKNRCFFLFYGNVSLILGVFFRYLNLEIDCTIASCHGLQNFPLTETFSTKRSNSPLSGSCDSNL